MEVIIVEIQKVEVVNTKKRMQFSKAITVYLLVVWTVTWLFSLFQANIERTLVPAVLEYVQGCLLIVLPYTAISMTDRLVYCAQAKYGGKGDK